MTNQSEKVESKKNWTSPQVTAYGDINTITQKNFVKSNGNGDDVFQIASDFITP